MAFIKPLLEFAQLKNETFLRHFQTIVEQLRMCLVLLLHYLLIRLRSNLILQLSNVAKPIAKTCISTVFRRHFKVFRFLLQVNAMVGWNMAKNPTLQLVPNQVILLVWISTRRTEIFNSKCYIEIQILKRKKITYQGSILSSTPFASEASSL